MLGAQRGAALPGSAEVTESCRARLFYENAALGWHFRFLMHPPAARYLPGRKVTLC